MTIIVRDGANTPRTITAIQVRDATNTPRDISEIWVRDSNNVPRLVFSLAPPLSVIVSPTTVSGFTSGAGAATTNAATATPTGGTPPYSYAWKILFFDNPVSPTVDTPASASSAFTQTNIGIREDYSATMWCVVTDSTPGSPMTAESNIISAFWSDIS